MKIFIFIFSLVHHWNRRSVINLNEFFQLVLVPFPSFWLRYKRELSSDLQLTCLQYIFIFSRLLLVCQYFAVNIS